VLTELPNFFSPMAQQPLVDPGPYHYLGFTITLRHTTLGRTPLDGCSARRRDLYLITHNTHKRQISMPPEEFEPAIPAGERPLTHALDCAATGIGASKSMGASNYDTADMLLKARRPGLDRLLQRADSAS
jgi:hypothetical protein